MKGCVESRDGVPIVYETCGAGKPALLLIHGWSCDRSYWAAQVEPLSASFQIITLDLGGHGGSGKARQSWTIDSFGQDVAAVADAVGADDLVLVGHSMGGNVAIAAARYLGERVKGIVWVDTHRKLGSPRTENEIQNFLAPFRASFANTTLTYVRGMFPAAADEALVRRVAGAMAAAPPAIALPALESNFAFGRTITDALKDVPAPVIAINADEPTGDAASLNKYGVEAFNMSVVGHFLMMDDPKGFNGLLREVVAKLTSY